MNQREHQLTATTPAPRRTHQGIEIPPWMRLENFTKEQVDAARRLHEAQGPGKDHDWPYWCVMFFDEHLRRWECEFTDDNGHNLDKITASKRAEELSRKYTEVRCMEARMQARWGPGDNFTRPMIPHEISTRKEADDWAP